MSIPRPKQGQFNSTTKNAESAEPERKGMPIEFIGGEKEKEKEEENEDEDDDEAEAESLRRPSVTFMDLTA